MAERKIVYIGDDVLRKKARRVRDFDDALNTLIDDMVETLAGAQGVGLAAPQIGVSQRVIVIHLPDDEESYGEQAGSSYEVVNPEIVKSSRETVEDVEACLSIPGYFGTVERSTMVVVRGQDRQGKEMRVKAYDWLARVFQHEIDHLDGVLYIDRSDEVWKVGEREAEEEAGEATPAAD